MMISLSRTIALLLISLRASAEEANHYKNFMECDDSIVYIEEITLTCDSPGAYYYGGSSYRNSETCAGGDKGRLQVYLQIMEESDDFESAVIDIYAKGYGSVSDATILTGANLCESVSSVDDSICPEPGYYKIQEVFYWDEQNDELEYSFSPKISVGFKSSEKSRSYDLGGANTDRCAGNSIADWSAGFRKSAANALKTFLVTFGILVGAVVCVLSIAYFIMQQTKHRDSTLSEEEENHNEYQKMAMVGNNATLVDA